ncbi:hypothetical protein Btru_077086 [Bulinus truncatus]|nr:hypothetical protein Btru_077086 [Bulinus truncatus]
MAILFVVAFMPLNLVSGNDVFKETCRVKSNKLAANMSMVSVCTDNVSDHPNAICSVHEKFSLTDFTVYITGQSMKDCPRRNEHRDLLEYRASCLKMDHAQLTKNIVRTMTRALSKGNSMSGFTSDVIGNLRHILGGVALIETNYECHSNDRFIDMCGNHSVHQLSVFLKFNRPSAEFQPVYCKCSVTTSSTVSVKAVDVRLSETLLQIHGRDHDKEWYSNEMYWKQDDPFFNTNKDFYIQLIMPISFPENVWLLLEGEKMNISCVSGPLMINYNKYGSMVALVSIILFMFNLVPILFYIVIKRCSFASRARDAVKRFSFLRINSDHARYKSSDTCYIAPQSGQYDEMIHCPAETMHFVQFRNEWNWKRNVQNI